MTHSGVSAPIEQVLRTHLKIPHGAPLPYDKDGDLPVQWRRSLLYIRELGGEPSWVRIWTHVVRDLEISAELLRTVNVYNSQITAARLFVGDETLFASTELPGASVSPGVLAAAFWAVGSLVEWIESNVIEAFGGRPGFDDPRAMAWR